MKKKKKNSLTGPVITGNFEKRAPLIRVNWWLHETRVQGIVVVECM